jgi:ketosteroid isomerase-like protein
MKNIALLSALAAVRLFAACNQTPAPGPDTTAADTAAVRANSDQFVTAWNAGNMAAITPLMTEDIILMQPYGPSNVGRDAVLKAVATGHDIAKLQQTHTTDEVTVSGGYAYAFGTWKLNPKPGVDAPAQHGKWSAIYKRNSAGAWQLWRWMWNEDGSQAAK